MSMLNVLYAGAALFMMQQAEITSKTNSKIEQIKEDYFINSRMLPRKAKKKWRKKLNLDYSFEMSMLKWQNENIFNF